MVRHFDYSKSTIIFKMNIVKVINKHPKIKNSFPSLNFLKNYFKLIKKICEENASKFEQIKNLFKIHQHFITFLSRAYLQPALYAEILVMTSLMFYYLFSVQLIDTINEVYLQECRLNFEPKWLSAFICILIFFHFQALILL